MKNFGIVTWHFLLFLLLTFNEGQSHTSESDHSEVKIALESIDVPDALLVDQNGKTVRLRQDVVGNNRTVFTFQFAECRQQCPASAAILAALVDEFAKTQQKDVSIVSITLDPDNDSPDKLLAKATEMGAWENWHWLTGSPEQLAIVYSALGVSNGPKENHDIFFLVGRASDGKFVRISGLVSPDVLKMKLDELGR